MTITSRIGLVGRKQSGKTTVANHLVAMGYTKMAFADPIKQAALDMIEAFASSVELWPSARARLPSTREQLEESKEAFRPLLQWLGYDLAQVFLGHPDFWIAKLRCRLRSLPSENFVVIDDVRFPHEVEALRELGFVIVLLERPVITDNDSHASEVLVSTLDFDILVDNCGGVPDLLATIDHIVGGAAVHDSEDYVTALQRETGAGEV